MVGGGSCVGVLVGVVYVWRSWFDVLLSFPDSIERLGGVLVNDVWLAISPLIFISLYWRASKLRLGGL